MSVVLGDRLLLGAKAATDPVLVVAPFIKRPAMARLADALPSLKLVCVTRWVPEEIVAGVSDLDVWDLFKSRPGWDLYLRSDLHAKYYRFGRVAFGGSANVTNKALGWCRNPNLELLLDVDPLHAEVQSFELNLLCGALRVNQQVVDRTAKAVAALRARSLEQPVTHSQVALMDENLEYWAPASRYPQHLFECYSEQIDRVITSVYEDGVRDLAVLALPKGLSKSEFMAFVCARLQQVSFVGLIDVAAADGLDPVAGQAIADSVGIASGEGNGRTGREWENLRQWLLYFLADRYREKHTIGGPVFERSVIFGVARLRPTRR